jgi:hypothetical protein
MAWIRVKRLPPPETQTDPGLPRGVRIEGKKKPRRK